MADTNTATTARVGRSYLIRVVQSYEVPASLVAGVVEEDGYAQGLYDLDEQILCGRLVADDTESVDDDDLQLWVETNPEHPVTAGQRALRTAAANLTTLLDEIAPGDDDLTGGVREALRNMVNFINDIPTIGKIESTDSPT